MNHKDHFIFSVCPVDAERWKRGLVSYSGNRRFAVEKIRVRRERISSTPQPCAYVMSALSDIGVADYVTFRGLERCKRKLIVKLIEHANDALLKMYLVRDGFRR